ncbi:hypothetical protein [Tunturiibacter gelidiferens]|uniref:hypothetical protein n=1 Tax=Tunturiibacter gelidiferens TaxID=3069689 RepID=UPI003D9AFF76
MTFHDAVTINRRGTPTFVRVYDILLLLTIPAYLFLNLFTLHNIPHYIVSDDGLFILDGLRMGAGQWIYRDFFQFNAPGIDYVFFFAFKLFGARAWVPNLVTLLLGTSLSWMTLYLARRIMPRSWADLTTILFVVFLYGRWLDATHHWFSLFAILLAITVVLPDCSPSRIAIAGALIGTAAFFTQTAGAAAWLAFAVTLFYEHTSAAMQPSMLRKQASLFLPAALVWYLLSAQTLNHVGWHTLWYFQFTFPQRYELRVDDNPIAVVLRLFPHKISFLQIENVVFYLLLLCTTPVALCVLLWKRLRNQAELQAGQMPILLLATVGFLLMAEVVTRPTWIRLYAVFLPSLMVLFAMLALPLRTRPRLNRLLMLVLLSAATLSAFRQTSINRAMYSSITSLPAGEIALPQLDTEELRFLAQHTHPGDMFFQAFAVYLYLPLALHSPVYMDYLRQSSVTRPEFLANAVRALETNHVRYVALRPASDITFSHAESHHLDPLYSWVEAHYTFVQRFPNNEELWELRR